MSTFKPITKLLVHRRLNNGSQILVGTLAQNAQGIYFQYNDDYLKNAHSLSPFHLDFSNRLHMAPKQPHNGLHGAFSDSLPDGWGTLLMDRVMRQHGVLSNQLTALDRLAYVGDKAIGALSYSPESNYISKNEMAFDIQQLASEALKVFDGQTDHVLALLANAGSSGGARPKAQIYLNPQNVTQLSGDVTSGLEPWLIKFTSSSLNLGHEEGLCEAAYLTIAKKAGITVPTWQLIPAGNNSPARAWLALKRFDCTANGGRYHMQSASGLLDADFRQPSLDYQDLIKAGQILCNTPKVGQDMFRRAVFNLFSANQDDHSKNWAFLMDDVGQWQPSPFYDATFSPTAYGEHSTAFSGFGKQPPLKIMQALAAQANFSSWKQAQMVIKEVLEAIQSFDQVAKTLDVKADTRRLICQYLENIRQNNKALMFA
jgi:serine/threonine-protein kinase HipA